MNLLNIIISNLSTNLLLNYFIDHNIIKFISHKYWRNNLNQLSMPQLITCSSHIYLNSSLSLFGNNLYVKSPIYFFIYFMISKMYKNEIKESIYLRFMIIMSFIFLDFF